MTRTKKWKVGLAFLLSTLFLAFFFYLFPSLGDLFYGNLIYPLIRQFYDAVFHVFDQSLMLFAIGLLLYILVNSIIQNGLFAGIKYLLFLLALFYWIWGFNYFRTPLSEQLNLEFTPVSDSLRLEITNATLAKCIQLSEELDLIEDEVLSEILLEKGLEMADTLSFLSAADLKVVPVQPATLFLRIGITGMYFPYTGQGQYESALGPVDKSFTMAHEWCHSSGIGPEHEANFLAYLMCISSDNTTVQYSAYMHLLNELLFYYKITNPVMFEEMIATFTPTMIRHLEERKAQFLKYSGPVSELSDEMIDQYLKFNQQEGIQDYHRLSEYVFAWEFR
jgi:hypothetical protein